MKTLCALALICLSVPAFAGDLDSAQPYDRSAKTAYTNELADDFDFRGFDFGSENTATITVPATPKNEDVWAEIWLGPDSSYEQATSENTATITVPAKPKNEDVWAEIWLASDSAYDQATAAPNAIAENETPVAP